MALLAVLLGLVAALAWGFGDFFGAKASKRFGGLTSAGLLTFLAASAYSLVYVFFLRQHDTLSMSGIVYGLLAAMLYTIGNLMFYKGLELGPVSVVSPISSLYPLVTTLLLVTLFGAHLTALQMVGIVIVMGGMLAASGLFERMTNGRRFSRGTLLGLAAGILWGAGWTFMVQATNKLGWQNATLVEEWGCVLTFLPALPLVVLRKEPGFVRHFVGGLKSLVALGSVALTMTGFLTITIGVKHLGDLTPIALVISACYGVLTALLALHKLDEKFDPIPVIGAFIAIGGVAILSLG